MPQIVGYDAIVGAIATKMGARLQHRHTRRGVEYAATLRGPRGPIVIRHEEVAPVEVGGKIGRKIKKGLKKVAKSKVLGKLAKVAMAVSSVVPGGQALALGGAALKAVQLAKKAVKGGKKVLKLGKGASKLVKAAAGGKSSAKALPSGGGRVVTVRSGKRYEVRAL